MEYCQLSDLAQFMKKRHTLTNFPETADIFHKYPNPPVGGLNEVLARHFVKQIASALEYLHAHNFIHRDIKPQNLLLNPAPLYMSRQKPEDVPLAASEHSLVPSVGVDSLPMLKIADFGFARHLPQATMAETLCGSPLYMAPEILRYEKYDARADLWSIGTVLHEMVVGKPPFRANNHVELLRRIEKAADNILFEKTMVISRDMKTLIRKLLKKSPLDRITYDNLFKDPVITGEIPGLVAEDRPKAKLTSTPDPGVSELSRRMAKQAVTAPEENIPTPSPTPRPSAPRTESATGPPKQGHDQDTARRPSIEAARRQSSGGSSKLMGTAPKDVPKPSSAAGRRPSIVSHSTAPSRQEIVGQSAPAAAVRMERRSSRSSPLAGPPMVREHSSPPEAGLANDERAKREAREKSEKIAHDVAFEKEYVVVEKRHVEINALADEIGTHQDRAQAQQPGTMLRRTTSQGHPTSTTGAQPASPSRAMQVMNGRQHQRAGSYERRYVPSPQTATNMLTKALNAANVRIFGALGTSPPFGKGASPPRAYGAFPAYPAPRAALTGPEADTKKLSEDDRVALTMEDAAHRSDVVYGFAEVKYRQLFPATPSTNDGLGILQLGAAQAPPQGSDGVEEEKDMTTMAIVGVSEEALVMYVKTLAILAKTIDLAGWWWSKRNRGEVVQTESGSPRDGALDISRRVNNVVQWARGRFNECLEKSEVVSRKLLEAQNRLPEDHPSHPSNHDTSATAPGNGITSSAQQIRITSGVTAEKLMFERAVEMSRAAAVQELVNEDLAGCELGYMTAILMLEAVLETDDEPLMRKPSLKKDKPADEIINGMETEDRRMVIKRMCFVLCRGKNFADIRAVVEGTRARLNALRKKQASPPKRTSNSSQTTPKPTSNPSPSATPAIATTPPQ